MLLPWLIFLPIIGGLLCWASERLHVQAPRWMALITMILTLLSTLILWYQGNYNLSAEHDWQTEYIHEWIPRLGINFHLAIDGLSLLMVGLTAILSLLSVLCSWKEVYKKLGLFHFNMMLMVAGVMGVFLAIDMFLFFFFWEVMLIPMYFMIAIWGHKGSNNQYRFSGATKFLIYTQTSGLLMLLSILALAYDYTLVNNGAWSFNYNDLMKTPLTSFMDSSVAEYVLMLGFFIAFAVKMPLFPLHGWLADAHAQAPTAGSIDISGLLLKTAAYGYIRFCIPIFPNASMEFAPVVQLLALISIFYGAWMAYIQTDMKRLIAYTSVSHMGLVMLALYSNSQLAYQGAIIQMIAHGLSAAGLFIISGQIYERFRTRNMNELGGLWSKLNYLPACTLFFAAATLGMPGTGNFVGEFMMFFGVFGQYPFIVTIAVFGVVFASVYSLMFMQRTFFGESKSHPEVERLSLRELSLLFILISLLLLLGFYPQPLLDISLSAQNYLESWFDYKASMPL